MLMDDTDDYNDYDEAESAFANDFDLGDLATSLSAHDEIFYNLYNMGYPSFTKSIDTACVLFDKHNSTYVQFLFNPKFFVELSRYSRNFVFCHECLHIVYEHGLRMRNRDPKTSNIAMDLAVNHSLLNKFDFNYNYLDETLRKSCFIWNIFSEEEIEQHNISDSECFEYYYNLLVKHGKVDNYCYVALDDHANLNGKDTKEILSELRESLGDTPNKDILGEINKHDKGHQTEKENPSKTAGTQPGNNALLVPKKRIIKKKKWETVIKRWAKKVDKILYKDQFIITSRRYYDVMQNIKGASLPTKYPYKNEKNKIELWAFQDTSGSCVHLADRFFNALNTIPTDRFNIRAFCFDTRVFEIDLKKRQLFGFGGTRFDVIEQYIQSKHKSLGVRYPDAVFIITDGYGNNVAPEHPNHWHWFLSCKFTNCIPKDSHIYMLEDFE